MKNRKVASRYARALLPALPAAQVDAASDFLSALGQAIEGSLELRTLLANPAVPRAERRRVLGALAEKAGMPERVVNFLYLIVDNGRSADVPAIAQAFVEERQRVRGIVDASVASASKLTPELAERVRESFERLTGRSIRLKETIDPSLIGGVVTRIGSTVYDGSVRTQLQNLRRRMVEE